MRVTVLAPDVSENGVGRALLLAEVLGLDHEVEVVGVRFGAEVWAPARGGRIAVDDVAAGYFPGFAVAAARILRRLRGDVVYAVKPLLPTLGLALLNRRLRGTPVVADVDDDELAFRPPLSLRRPRSLLSALGHPDARGWTRLAVRRLDAADALTVATRALRERHGGALVPHARDTDRLRPRPDQANAAREALGVGGRRAIVFLGTPRRHKGIEDVAEAVRKVRAPAVLAVVGADERDPYVRALRARFPEALWHPPTSLERGAFLLQGADAVVVAQREDDAAAAQLPAKLVDAMALAKPVVATAVSDIPWVLGEGRGRLVPPGDTGSIAAALDAVFADPAASAAMGERARAWCVEHASHHAVRRTLAGVLGRLVPSP